MTTFVKPVLFTLTLSAALVGCSAEPPAIIGGWVGVEIGPEPNLLDVGDDLAGRARIYYYVDGEPSHCDFDVTCDACSDGWCCEMAGRDCGYRWLMTCPDSEPTMSCTGSNDFASFTFAWRKQ